MWNRVLSGSFVVAVCLEAAVLGWANAATTPAPGSADRNAYQGKKQGYAVVQNTQNPAQPPLFEFFEYRDAETGAGGHIRLSLKFGESWAVENPWRHSSTSIIAQP